MLKRAVLYTSVMLATLAVTAGCTSGDSTTTTSANATSTTTPEATEPKSPASTATATRTSDPGDTELPEGVGDDGILAGLGKDADWAKLVTACPDERQAEVIQKVVLADLTGDGTDDAVVGRTCESITTYWPSTVEIFDGMSEPSRPRRIGTLLKDVGPTDKPWLTELQVSGNKVDIEAIGTGEGDSSCADLGFTYGYRYRDGKFTRVARTVGDANECQRIG